MLFCVLLEKYKPFIIHKAFYFDFHGYEMELLLNSHPCLNILKERQTLDKQRLEMALW